MANGDTIPTLTKSFAPKVKEIKYLNKTFPEFRQSLIDFAKVYFPSTYTDFNETSPGMMFIEMASYVGDVMSYYIDAQFRENLLTHAEEQENIIHIAQAFGFRPKPATAARTKADFFQLVPALGVADGFQPDERYYLKIAPNGTFQRSEAFGSVNFRNVGEIDFSDVTDRSITVYSVDGSSNPLTYLVRKKALVESGDIKTIEVTFGDPEKFSKWTISDKNALGIVRITDSNGNRWDEVDYLAQDLVIDGRVNATPNTAQGYSMPPQKVLKFKKQPRRYITRYSEDFELEIFFGSGVLSDNNELITLDTSKIASSEFSSQASSPLDPVDFLLSSTFGLAPSNTTLTITYVVGGGIESNVPANTINKILQVSVVNDRDVFTDAERLLFDDIARSLAVNNAEPATGGKGEDTVEEIRQQTLAYFNSQNRLVTPADYTVRCYSMQPLYGGIAKAFVIQDDQLRGVDQSRIEDVQTTAGLPSVDAQDELVINEGNPRLVNVYVLGFNDNKNLKPLNDQTKLNLKRYLEQYKMITDQINIIDAFVVNIGISFKISVFKNYNVNDVLAQSIDAVKQFFSVDRWDINQPIILNDLRLQIASVEGVQSVIELNVNNKYAFKDGGDYENYRYDIEGNALDVEAGIVYPSLDPMIFEVRFPDTDIIGQAVQ